MINLTPLARPLFSRRIKAVEAWRGRLEQVQRAQLDMLLRAGRRTRWGADHGFDAITSYELYRDRMAVTPYSELRPLVMRMIDGEPDLLWPGVTRHFAQSSGTGDGKSKYIPVTDASLRLNHYRGGADVVAHYLNLYPDSRLFSGKAFILGGSYGNELKHCPPQTRVGDLSANLIDRINPVANMFRVPSKRIALMEQWQEKLPALIAAASGSDVTNISGVPSWFLTVLRGVIEKAGASTIHDVWPNLEVFFHGGISMEPYREQYRAITDPARMRYLETYNASEGFFAVQDRRDARDMLLLVDAGVFYEFVAPEADGEPHPEAIPAWQVEQGKTYALIITAANGLWRYAIGDTVTVTSTDPLRIRIAGRTRHFINAFGEELMVHNADAAIADACRATGASVANYTAAPVYTTERTRGHHQWLIEWTVAPRGGNEAFATALDKALCEVNSDYQAKRSGNIFLAPPELTEAPTGLFDRWLIERGGKLGGQRKIPRLSNSREVIDSMLALTGLPNADNNK